eukprot:TRINITY_DN2482_c0_g1_i1.p3 TRINITY_DN2482_c0_g1~~TRINITY_DN2482_c0_g1_i1.p3  ORF type:complete len:52 (-),score=0.22 TRINITY_DN2482_c0_g1_i1:325-480(-)
MIPNRTCALPSTPHNLTSSAQDSARTSTTFVHDSKTGMRNQIDTSMFGDVP